MIRWTLFLITLSFVFGAKCKFPDSIIINLMKRNQFCSLPIDKETFIECLNRSSTASEQVIKELRKIVITGLPLTQNNLESEIHHEKMEIILAFMDHPKSPLCLQLTLPDYGYLSQLRRRFCYLRHERVKLAEYWHYVLLNDNNFYKTIGKLFLNQLPLAQFIYPNFHWINQQWDFMNLSTYNDKLRIKQKHFVNAMQLYLEDYVDFYCAFYDTVNGQDLELFSALVNELGMPVTESKFIFRLMMSQQDGGIKEVLACTKLLLIDIGREEDFAECVISFMLSASITRQIINQLKGIGSIESFNSFHQPLNEILGSLRIIDELTIKGAIASTLLAEIDLNLRDVEYNKHLTSVVLVEIALLDCNISIMKEFFNDLFNLKYFNEMNLVYSMFRYYKPTMNIALFQRFKCTRIDEIIAKQLKKFLRPFNQENLDDIAYEIMQSIQPEYDGKGWAFYYQSSTENANQENNAMNCTDSRTTTGSSNNNSIVVQTNWAKNSARNGGGSGKRINMWQFLACSNCKRKNFESSSELIAFLFDYYQLF